MPRPVEPPPLTAALSKKQLKPLIKDLGFLNSTKTTFTAGNGTENFKIFTSLKPELQAFLVSTLEHSKTLTRGKPQRIGIVVMEGSSGHILAMAGFDLEDPKANPCTVSDYPAASVFKIVTATAAIDAMGYTPHTPLYFNGNKYTLYKRQLKDLQNQYTVETSLAKAFAQSINPVFGKLGKNVLGPEKLQSYARAFGFNLPPLSELEFEPGRFNIGQGGYHLAELGCGFNTDTRISPIFAAVMAGTVLNQGKSPVPVIVSKVANANGEVVYKARKEFYNPCMTPQSAKKMMTLMKTTISHGTARKSFRGVSSDAVLSNLVIGGKTGSLFNKEHTIKYDWFTGFGKEKTSGKSIALAVVVGHREYIGTRACSYGKMILKQYFTQTGTALTSTTQDNGNS